MKRKFYVLIIILLIIGIILTVILMNKSKEKTKLDSEVKCTDNSFNLKLIKNVNINNEDNYLISPYSIEIALNLLKAGADGETLKELNNVIGARSINNVAIKDRVSVANAAFIGNMYKQYLLSEYQETITEKYNSEILYDDFKTPKVINDWVNNITDGMIKEILSEIDKDFVMGLANALAIDVEWAESFECESTTSQKFTLINGNKINTEMMHKTLSNGYKYIESDDAIGVVIPYKKYDKATGEEVYEGNDYLEFIAILPNDNLHNYINSLTEEKLNNLYDNAQEAGENFEIELSLPRFKYDYDLDNFKEVLQNIGINDVFDAEKANLTKIMPRSNDIPNLYVGQAIHKTHIDLNEKGTKAAAITYFGLFKATGFYQGKEKKEVTLDRPFMYIIRDNKTHEMLFFGTVYKPNEWTGSTCSEDSNE